MSARVAVVPRSVLILALLATPAIAVPATAQEEADRTTIGGYGEVHYSNATGPRTPGVVNVKRFVVFLAHAFSDRITFRSELELEDTKIEGGEDGGEVALEQAYLDYRFSDAATLRTGLVLAPIGIINETHEPPGFNGVARPLFDREVLPSTWREIGVGLVGSLPGGNGFNYRVYLVSGLKAEGFGGGTGIRGGRQEGKEASFANPSLTGRLEWARPGLRLGGSFWYGGTAAEDSVLGEGTFDSPLFLVSADARYDVGPFALRGVLAMIRIGHAGDINARYGSDIGERIQGGYLEGAVNLLHYLAPASSHKLNAFVRHERYDLHAAVPSGTAKNDSYARRSTALGLSYKPLWNVVFKGDYQFFRNVAGAAESEMVSLGVGYQF